MTPHGHHQQPPIVGTCLRCYQPVQGPHVAFPAGPMHPECAQALAPQPKARAALGSPALKVVFWVGFAIVVVFGFVVFLKKTTKDHEKRQAGIAAASAEVNAPAEKERVVFLWCDSTKRFCDPNDHGRIKLYASAGDFDNKDGVWCRGGKRRCVEPSRPLLEVPGGTRAALLVLEGARFWSKVRVLEGAGSGKIAIVDNDHVHDTPPR